MSLDNENAFDEQQETHTLGNDFKRNYFNCDANSSYSLNLPIALVKSETNAECIEQVTLINGKGKSYSKCTGTEGNVCNPPPDSLNETDLLITNVRSETKTEHTEYTEQVKSKDDTILDDIKLTTTNVNFTNKWDSPRQGENLHAFPCLVCKEIFNNKRTFIRHMRSHAGKKDKYKYEICYKVLKSKELLTKHLRIHTGDDNIVCKVCGKFYTSKQAFKSHLNLHTGLKLYKCETCAQRFVSSANLKQHLFIHTDNMPKYICNVCNISFRWDGSLRQHMSVHTGERVELNNIKCNVCDKHFTKTSSLKSHMMSHSEKKNYNCQVCDTSFKRRNALINHLKQCNQPILKRALRFHVYVHKGEREKLKHLTCNVCDKAFTTTYYLKSHMKKHSEEKPYICKICDAAFKQRNYLLNHLKLHDNTSLIKVE